MTQERGAPALTLLTIRGFDLLFSLVALVALSPLLVLVVIALRFSGEGEVFYYRQIRIGKGGREFRLLKFATMMKNSPAMGSGELTLPNDPRVLPLGRILRKTKLNELPQLLNIVAGDLSVIGPRPQTRRYYNCYAAVDRAWIDTIRPGLSGVGSILFRDEEALLANVADPVTFDYQVISPYKGRIERWFAANQSVSLYFELIITTVLVVLLPSSKLHQRLLSRVPTPPAVLSKLLANWKRDPTLNVLNLLGRREPLFDQDIAHHEATLRDMLSNARCLVIGGAGTIGHGVTRELFKRDPAALHVVDISENNMVELVREIRSTSYGKGDFRTFAIDCGSLEFAALFHAEGPYDYVFNLSALKHVRSEKDPFTLMRMIQVNVFNTVSTLRMAKAGDAKKYFCVSTDKAANPVNMMGASKRIMELFLMRESLTQSISMARFANVAFSDGSLLHGFNQRFAKRQPISAPCDVRRYFVTQQESGELCLLSAMLGENRDIFFPKLNQKLHLITFSEIAQKYLRSLGYEPYECQSEDEARTRAEELIRQRKWPCYFFSSDTTGEKDFEEFFTEKEDLDMSRLESVGVIRNPAQFYEDQLQRFEHGVNVLREQGCWNKTQLLELFFDMLPDFAHLETGKYLDQRM